LLYFINLLAKLLIFPVSRKEKERIIY